MDAEYYIKQLAPELYTVAKFERTDSATEVYRVEPGRGGTCQCVAWLAGRARPCKHIRMVRDFISAGRPVPFLVKS